MVVVLPKAGFERPLSGCATALGIARSAAMWRAQIAAAASPTGTRRSPTRRRHVLDRGSRGGHGRRAGACPRRRARPFSLRRRRTTRATLVRRFRRGVAAAHDGHSRHAAGSNDARQSRRPLAVAARRGCQYPDAIHGMRVPPKTAARTSGCSSMVEQQPSKLMTRVRFPSPAPILALHPPQPLEPRSEASRVIGCARLSPIEALA